MVGIPYLFYNLPYFCTMNLPNFLSAFRILISLIAPLFVVAGGFWIRVIAAVFCFIAVLTDWIDGWYARKYNQVSITGKILDPIADKVYIIMTFSVMAYLDMFSFWWLVPIFMREIVITIYRFIFLSLGKAVAAVKSGKIKTFAQVITIAVIFFLFMWRTYYPHTYHPWLDYVTYASLLFTLFITLYSGFVFFQNNWKLIKNYHAIS